MYLIPTARSLVLSSSNYHSLRAMTPPFHPENAFSLPTPLVPKLVALGLDTKTAATLSNVYTTAALNLKEVCETEYTRACDAIMATGEYRGHSSKEISSKLLTVAVARYTQALSNWAEEAAERVKACLLHRSEKVIPEPKVAIWFITYSLTFI